MKLVSRVAAVAWWWRETLKGVNQRVGAWGTPLKRGVNERAADRNVRAPVRAPVQICAVVMMALLVAGVVRGEDTNTVEVIKQLQRRIDELERKVEALQATPKTNEAKAQVEGLDQKVNALEQERKAAQEASETKTKQVEELDQKVRILERNRELDQEAAAAKAKEAPRFTVGNQGFSLASASGDFAVQLKGVLQVDSRTFFHDSGIAGNDSLLVRRARPILQGTVYRDFDFLFVPDFAPSTPTLFDAYVNYRYSPELQLQAGKFKSPIGLEQLAADVDTLFNERTLVTDLVPNRDIGFALHGDLFGGVASYAAGIFNGVGDARNSSNVDFEDDKAFEGRIFFQPFKPTSITALRGLGFGLGGSYEDMQATNALGLPNTTGGSLPGFTTDGQQQFFAYNPSNAVVFAAGQHWRLSPQAYYYWGPFGLMGEYAISEQEVTRAGANQPVARLDNRAWEVTGSWVLTGEDAAYRGGVSPRHSFNPRQGGWGALQLVGRYAELKVDDGAFPLYANPLSSARAAAAWSVGLNWYLNRNVMVKASFSHTDFRGGGGPGTSAPAAVTQTDENVFFTRVQLGF